MAIMGSIERNMTADTQPRATVQPSSRKRRLIIRLSSIGDIILASGVLGAFETSDWVVAREFAEILEGHPGIGRVWGFDRKSGLQGWLDLCRKLHAEGYDEVIALNQTLRSRLARRYFARADRESGQGRRTVWKVCRKPRFRSWGYFIFKGLWPRSWRPGLIVDRYASFIGRSRGELRPDLSHLLVDRQWPEQIARPQGPYFCVMPGSQWKGKRWPVLHFASLIGLLQRPVVVMGTSRDRESSELVEQLRKRGLQPVDAVGKLSLRECAQVLAHSSGYIGNDTGLGHLAEAVGVPAHMIFGPTAPDQGFGPWKPGSTASGATLWCRPCGKDGRSCFRVFNRYRCMSVLPPSQVAKVIASGRGESDVGH